MRNTSNKNFGLILSIVCILGLISCGGSGGGSGGGGSSSIGIVESGTVSVALVDSASEDYAAVYITISDIQFHLGGNENSSKSWKSIQESIEYPVTVNLLELVNGVRLDLGLVELSTGHHTQMRLIIGEEAEQGTINILSQDHPYANYVIKDKDLGDAIDPEIHELKVPSGDKTGTKIVGSYNIAANQTTELILDFDACRSVVQAGKSGQWLLKPTIKMGETPEYSIIKGQVTDGDVTGPEILGLEGVLVSAQQYDSEASDVKEEVIVTASTLTDENGFYSLFVEPGDYNIVASRSDKNPVFDKVTVLSGQALAAENGNAINFGLTTSSENGWIVGTVTIPGAENSEQYATLSFRQDADCTECELDEKIEIKSLNILNSQAFNPDPSNPLPTGQYSLVASTFGYDTETYSVGLEADEEEEVPVVF
jgi:hypothetical protein